MFTFLDCLFSVKVKKMNLVLFNKIKENSQPENIGFLFIVNEN